MNIPELGPLLGSLTEPAIPSESGAGLQAVRLTLIDSLYQRALTARRLARTEGEEAARAALDAGAWLEVWEQAVAESGRIVAGSIERGLREAAAVSRYPKRRLDLDLPGVEESRVRAARFSAAGIGLEAAVRGLSSSGSEWQEALRRTAGELEMAWLGLLRIAQEELGFWQRRAGEIRAWRRSWKPLLVGAAAGLALASWVGLILGGYLPVPGPLRPIVEWIWSLPWP